MIKASFEVIQPANGQSFLFRKFDKTAFEAPYPLSIPNMNSLPLCMAQVNVMWAAT